MTNRCAGSHIEEVQIDKIKSIVDHEDFRKAADIFKALADETRLKITYILCQEEKLCVCDIATTIGVSTATASHHLRLLKNVGIAKYQKEGKLVYYSIDDDHVRQLVLNGILHSREEK